MQKNILSIVALCACCTCSMVAQSEPGTWSITPKVGVNISSLTGEAPMQIALISYSGNNFGNWDQITSNDPSPSVNFTRFSNKSVRFGYNAGVEFSYQLSSRWAIAAEVGYSLQGTSYDNVERPKIDTEDYHADALSIRDARFSMHYVNVPLLARYYITAGLAIEAGIQPGYCFNRKGYADVTDGNRNINIDNEADVLSKFDVSVPLGVSYQFNQFVIGARYKLGLTNVYGKSWDSFSSKSNGHNSVIELTAGYRFDL